MKNLKREYFGMLAIIGGFLLLVAADNIFGEEAVDNYLSTYIVVVIAIAYSFGQYLCVSRKLFRKLNWLITGYFPIFIH